LPLQLQNLCSDVLCFNNAKLAALGFRPKVSQRQGLFRLAQDLGFIPTIDRRPVTIVTGAASGIGHALAEQLKSEGHCLLLIDHNAAALADVASLSV
jgi:nucleoside-diphosphate-sugar epimerase